MSEVKHAREPWTLGAIENQAQGGKMQMIDSLEHGGLARVWITTDGIDSPRNKANAERIVACVNACEGVSPEDLRGLSVKGLLDGYLQDDKAKKDLEKRLGSARADAKHQKELYEYVSALNSRLAVEKRELEKALDEEKKRHAITAEREDELAKEGAELARELHATKEVLETQKIDYETQHQAWEQQKDTISKYQTERRELMLAKGRLISDIDKLSAELVAVRASYDLSGSAQLEKQRWIFQQLSKDLQAIIRAARWGQAPYAVDISTLQAVLQHYGVLPNGD